MNKIKFQHCKKM